MKDLLICSAGRGKLIADEINKIVPGRYFRTHLVDPQMEIALSDVWSVLKEGVSKERLLRKQVGLWLWSRTEGRPIVGGTEYLYGEAGFNDFRRDVDRIATLKLRAVLPYLLEANLRGEDHVDVDILSRDTGQVIKAWNHDLFIYQSHPGSDFRDQFSQFTDLFDAERAVVGTSCVLARGRISTATPQDIFSFFHYLHSVAYGLNYSGELPRNTDICIDRQFFIGSFLVTPEAETLDEIFPVLRFENIPGGVDWGHFCMEELVECWRGSNGKSYSVGSIGNFFDKGDWLNLVSGTDRQAANDFTAVRQGRPPRMELMRMMEMH